MSAKLSHDSNDPLDQIRAKLLAKGCPPEFLPSDDHLVHQMVEIVLSEFMSHRKLDLWIERYTRATI